MSERVTQWCQIDCECGQKHGAHLGHYDRVEGSCGRVYWALAPGRGPGGGYGPLKLYLWPGFPGLTVKQSARMLTVKPNREP